MAQQRVWARGGAARQLPDTRWRRSWHRVWPLTEYSYRACLSLCTSKQKPLQTCLMVLQSQTAIHVILPVLSALQLQYGLFTVCKYEHNVNIWTIFNVSSTGNHIKVAIFCTCMTAAHTKYVTPEGIWLAAVSPVIKPVESYCCGYTSNTRECVYAN